MNINPIAGTHLGSRYTKKTYALMSEAKIGENNLGKSLSAGTKALISAAISIVKITPPYLCL